MISLLQTLGEPGAQDRIGPAMATALVATFYGLVAANLVFIPIAEKFHEVAQEDVVMRNLIKEGILMIQEKRHPLLISEYLKSFLDAKDRGTAGSTEGASGAKAA
jgi:chemotaxis protein MotA